MIVLIGSLRIRCVSRVLEDNLCRRMPNVTVGDSRSMAMSAKFRLKFAALR